MKNLIATVALVFAVCTSVQATDFDLSSAGGKGIPGTVSDAYIHRAGDFGGFTLAGNHRVKLTSSGPWLALSSIVWVTPNISTNATSRASYSTVLTAFQTGAASTVVFNLGEASCDATQNTCTYAHFHVSR